MTHSIKYGTIRGIKLISAPPDQKPILKPPAPRPPEEIDGSVQTVDTDYQEIFYCKGGIKDAMPFDPGKLTPIGLGAALAETTSLSLASDSDKNNTYAWIVFYNQKKLQLAGHSQSR